MQESVFEEGPFVCESIRTKTVLCPFESQLARLRGGKPAQAGRRSVSRLSLSASVGSRGTLPCQDARSQRLGEATFDQYRRFRNFAAHPSEYNCTIGEALGFIHLAIEQVKKWKTVGAPA